MSADHRLLDHLLGLLDEQGERELQRELAASPELQAELAELREAFYALPEAGPLETAPAGAWQAIRARRAARTPPAPHRGRARPWLAAAAALALAAVGFGWGEWQRERAAQLDREQRVLAYWMLDPDMTILRLEPPPGSETSGIVCLLPEGRTLLLQTRPPSGRDRYRVWGTEGGQRTLIGETDGRMLVFDRGGFERIEVEIGPPGGADGILLGSVALESGNPHTYD